MLGYLVLLALSRIHRRLVATEAMLESVMIHLKLDGEAATEPSASVKQLAADPKSYVAAIKAYRQRTGLGLKPAKAAIDRIVSDPRSAA